MSPEDIRKLISTHNRRLQRLKQQQALAGFSVDPKVPLEIEDIEDKVRELETELNKLENEVDTNSKSVFSTDISSQNEVLSKVSEKEQEVYFFIESFIEKERISPTVEEIRQNLNISSKSVVHRRLKKLKKVELITYQPKKPRSIRLTKQDYRYLPETDPFRVRVRLPLGRITAGEPIEVPELIMTNGANFEGDFFEVDIPRQLEKEKKFLYVLKVIGNSMIDANINDGDVVVMDSRGRPDKFGCNNQIFAVWLLDREETTLKYVYYENNDTVILQPANKEFTPMRTNRDNIEIQGRVVERIKL